MSLLRTLWASSAAMVILATAGFAAAGEPDPAVPASAPTGPDAESELDLPDWTVERVDVVGNRLTSSALIRRIVGVKLGARWDEKAARIARLRLLTTGYFNAVELSLEKGSRRGFIVLVVNVTERNTVLLADLFLASSREVPVVVGLEVADTNFLGEGMYLAGAFVAGKSQAAFRLRWYEPTLFHTRLGIGATALFVDAQDFFGYPCRTILEDDVPTSAKCRDMEDTITGAVPFAPLHYQRLGGSLGLSYAIGDFTSMYLDFRVESLDASFPVRARTAVPDEGELEAVEFGIVGGRSLLAAAVFTVETDTRDHPFLPRSGFLLHGSAEGATKAIGTDYGYLKLVAHVQAVWRVRKVDALKLDVFTGAIIGDTPFFNRFFIGDISELVPQRNLEVAMTGRGAHPIFSSTISRMRYESFAARASVEYAIQLMRSDGPWIYGVDFFARLGLFFLASEKHLRRVGDDLGVPVDMTFDAGLRVDTRIGDFGLSVGNAIGVAAF